MKSPEKFVASLTDDQIKLLKELMKKNLSERVRMRSHCILLSSKKLCIDEISAIYDVNRNTVSTWINNWETEGVQGLFDNPRSGAPPKFNDLEFQVIKEIIDETPQSPKTILAKIEARFKKKLVYPPSNAL